MNEKAIKKAENNIQASNKDTDRADYAIKHLRDFIELRKVQGKMAAAENKDHVVSIANSALLSAYNAVRSVAKELGVEQ